MTIHRLLKETSFDPEAVRRLVTAFEESCRSLGLAEGDARRDLVAKKVIEIAQGGERDPERLRERAIAALK